ncbi:MAG: hypothetical protein V9G10_05065 [Candidatus Nanopelagicales bacterium]
MIGTAFWYVQTDQWRYDNLGADLLATPLGEGRFQNATMIDTLAQSARSGWMPSFPSLNRNPLELVREAREAGVDPVAYVTEKLKSGDVKFAVEDPDAPENWPRVLTIWRANLLGSSSKGNEYFLKHLLGTSNAVRADETDVRPQSVEWHEEASRRKARPADQHRLPDDLHRVVRRRPAAGCDLVREARPEQHGHAPVRARVHAGYRPAVGDQERLRHLPGPRPQGVRTGWCTSAPSRT